MPRLRKVFLIVLGVITGTVLLLIVGLKLLLTDERLRTAIEPMMEEALGREVSITSEKDPALIGGVSIRAGDLVIDGSIRGRLQQLANELGI